MSGLLDDSHKAILEEIDQHFKLNAIPEDNDEVLNAVQDS